MSITSRTRSVFPETKAGEFMHWMNGILAGLSETERGTATVDIRAVDDFFMVGLRWFDDDKPTESIKRGAEILKELAPLSAHTGG